MIPFSRFPIGVCAASRYYQAMSEHSRPYVIHSDEECERLELQARLSKIETHLRFLPVSATDRVLDAGCGSGLLTKQLAKQVPRGKIYAVDIDSNMIKQAKNNLQFFDNVQIMQSSFTDIRLPRKMDVIFSNSALHWIQDHRKAFQNFWEMLKPTN